MRCDSNFCRKRPHRGEKLDYLVFENRPKDFRTLLSWAKKLRSDIPQEDILFVCETTSAYDRALYDYIYSKGLDI